MAKINFVLKDINSENETLIFMIYNINNQRLKYSTGEFILPKAWDPALKMPKLLTEDLKKYPHNSGIERRLAEYQFFMIDQIGELKRKKEEITADKLRVLLDKNFKKVEDTEKHNPPEPKKKVENLDSYIERYIKECKDGKRLTPKGKKYKDWTKKGYTTLTFHLNAYCKLREKKIDFKDITMAFYNDFLMYFNDQEYALNTIGKHIKNIKVIMNAAFDEGLHTNLDYKKKSFRTVTEETDAIYLNEEELDKLYAYDFSQNKRLEKIRDLFIVGARTGLRFSDFTNLKEQNFFKHEGDDFIKIRTQKTGSNVVIPASFDVIEIYNKYEEKLPREISNQKMNEYLKEIGKLLDFDTWESKTITKGGSEFEKRHRKYELLTTHTARRSFATNMHLAGFPAISIMKITGHKTEKAFMKYIRMSEEENAFKMAKHDYFKGKRSNLKIVS